MNLLPSLLALAAASAAASALAQAPNQQNENAANAKCAALKNAALADVQITRAEWSSGGIGADAMSALTGGSAATQ